MAMEAGKLRDKALKAMQSGQFDVAAEYYKELVKVDRKEIAHCLRVAEAYSKAGNVQRTIFWYATAAKKFAQTGHLPKAIAAAKMVLTLKPEHEEIKPMLAELYAKKDRSSIGTDSLREHLVMAEPEPQTSSPIQLETTATVSTQTRLEVPPPTPPTIHSPVEESASLDLGAESALHELPKVPLFSDLEPAAFEGLIDAINLRAYEAGESILVEGEKGDAFFILTSGSVSVQKENAAGMTVTLARLEEGAFFGEFAYLAGTLRSASVIAETDVETLEVNRKGLDRLATEHPKVKKALQKFYHDRVLQNLLALSPLFEPLGAQEKMQVLALFRFQEFPAGAVLLEEGIEGRELSVIVSGSAKVTQTKSDSPGTLASLKEGDFFGEMSLLRGEKTSAKVTAVTPVSVFSLPASEFNRLTEQYPQLKSVLQAHAEERRMLNASRLAEAGMV